ncbi:hypothetical protein D3C85_270510 [compost metagenome]
MQGRNVITDKPVDQLVLPWESAVSIFRMHLANKMLKLGMKPADIQDKLNDLKDVKLLEDLTRELFGEAGTAGVQLTIGHRGEFKSDMSLITACEDGIIVKMTPRPMILLTIEDVEAAIQKAYPEYTVWTDGEDRVYVDEGDDDPNLMSPTDAYQKYIVEAGK